MATRWAAACALALLLAGCGSADHTRAGTLATRACTLPAPSAGNFDPQTASMELLADLSKTAQLRADLAAEAAALDARWQALSDASSAIAAYADRIREIRRDGGLVAELMPLAVWEQVKYASDAFVLECRTAVGDADAPSGL